MSRYFSNRYQAPALRGARADGPRRFARLHFRASSKLEASQDPPVHYPACDVEIEAGRVNGHTPTVWIKSSATGQGVNPDHAERFDLRCDELVALGALAEITLTAEPEDSHPRDHFDNPADVSFALANDTNEWAWCCARVTASWCGFTAVEYLGGCSYRSEADFRAAGGYFDDMVVNVLTELRAKIARAGGLLK